MITISSECYSRRNKGSEPLCFGTRDAHLYIFNRRGINTGAPFPDIYPSGVAGEHVTEKRASPGARGPGRIPRYRPLTRLVPSTLFRWKAEEKLPFVSVIAESPQAVCVRNCIADFRESTRATRVPSRERSDHVLFARVKIRSKLEPRDALKP